MKVALIVVAFYIAGAAISSFLVGDHRQVTEILGTTYSELSSMKEECELTLPRNQHCVASIVFLPTAIEE